MTANDVSTYHTVSESADNIGNLDINTPDGSVNISHFNDSDVLFGCKNTSSGCSDDFEMMNLDSVSPVSDSVLDEGMWSQEQKSVMMEHKNYWLDVITQAQAMIECITIAMDKKPLEEKDVVKKMTVKMPSSDIYEIICSDGPSTNRKKKRSSTPLEKMSCDEFNNYLKSLVVESGEDIADFDVNAIYSSECNMRAYLKANYRKLGKKMNDLLREHILFGKELKLARTEFKKNQKKWMIKEKWQKWIVTEIDISNSCVRRYIQMYDLVNNYPKLLQLLQLRPKIEIQDGGRPPPWIFGNLISDQ